MKISVIMAAYNAASYIEESVMSIINQTYKNWELIICDDNSSDSTFEILNKLALEDDRIILIHNEKNMKAAYSRNLCIKKSKGQFIAIQDADDISSMDRLEKQIDFLNNNQDIDFVGSSKKSFDNNFNWSETKLLPFPEKKDFLISFPFVHASILFRAEILHEVKGYRVSKETTRGQDSDMIMRLYAKGYKGANLQEPLYFYREGEVAEKRRKLKYRLNACKVRYKRFKELGLFPKAIPFIFVPVIGGLIPQSLKKIITKKG